MGFLGCTAVLTNYGILQQLSGVTLPTTNLAHTAQYIQPTSSRVRVPEEIRGHLSSKEEVVGFESC